MYKNETNDNTQYYEAQRLSDEILKEKSLPRKNYSQHVIKLMREKIEFFKMDSGKISIEYNAISGRLIIINGNRQILCQRDDPKFDKQWRYSTYQSVTGPDINTEYRNLIAVNGKGGK